MAIVVGFVPKPQGEAAVRLAAREGRAREEKVHLVNWSSGEAWMDGSFASDADLDVARSILEDAGASYEIVQSVGRDGADGVLETANSLGANLIVIGLRHRTSAGKFLFGSNAQRILMEAPCPVLTVTVDSESR